MKIIVSLGFFLVFFCTLVYSQNTITGTFPNIANEQVKLIGFEGFNTYIIDSVKVNENGSFNLSFGLKDYGMGYLAAEDNKAFIVILAANENLKLKGESLAFPETIVITSGNQNLLFEKYAKEHPRREQAFSAWDYLAKIYKVDPLFSMQEIPINTIEDEKNRIKHEDEAFLKGLGPQSYVSWFLPMRKLVSSIPTIAQYRPEEIPTTIANFRNIDYNDPKMYKSGLLRETIDAHFWLIENSGKSLDTVYAEINKSIDHLIENLVTDERKFNEITDYLFKLLESRSLFTSSEYLALKVLNGVSCIINKNLASQLESYRAMKVGKTAPDFDFKQYFLASGNKQGKTPQKLSDLKSKYIVVVFGASWCPMCTEELSKITRYYEKWTKFGVEVVFISLDDNKLSFRNLSAIYPFISLCDYKKWDSPVVKDYYVFATPTIYLLNDKLEIILRPNSVQQMDAWVEWYLIQGKKIQ